MDVAACCCAAEGEGGEPGVCRCAAEEEGGAWWKLIVASGRGREQEKNNNKDFDFVRVLYLLSQGEKEGRFVGDVLESTGGFWGCCLCKETGSRCSLSKNH